MEELSTAVLVLLGLVIFANYKNGTLGQWVGAKFLNRGTPGPTRNPWSDVGGGEFGSPPGGGSGWKQVGLGVDAGLGKLLAPITGGRLTGHFGTDRGTHRHAGIDWAVPVGTPVRAARAGRVTFAGPSSSYGLRVDLDHGTGFVTKYAHLSSIKVRLGQTVTAGQLIALSGNTGRSTGPHLHFETRQNGSPIDPLGLLGLRAPAEVA
jgi:murein DD-endopeptidase MepM/ murein hydrolase activator NlpD